MIQLGIRPKALDHGKGKIDIEVFTLQLVGIQLSECLNEIGPRDVELNKRMLERGR